MKKFVLGALVLAFVSLGSPAFALRVAYIDVQKVFEGYQGTQSAKDKLKAEAESQKGKLEAQQDELKKQLDDLHAQKAALSEEKYNEREAKVQSEVKDLQAQIQQVQSDLAEQEQKMTMQILDQIREVVQVVAERDKYDYVFERNTLLYGGDEITASVISELNTKK